MPTAETQITSTNPVVQAVQLIAQHEMGLITDQELQTMLLRIADKATDSTGGVNSVDIDALDQALAWRMEA